MAEPQPWFANRKPQVLFYKVNRRPFPQTNLFGERADPFAHFIDVLPFGEPVRTGRRFGRTWFLGDKTVDETKRMLVAQIGWQRPETQQAARFDRDRQTWVDAVLETPAGNHAPFVYDGETGRLAVLRHPTFSDTTVAHVFTRLLNSGEKREGPTVEWEVAPLLDAPSFRAWLESTRAVGRVSFVARLPNPDVLDEFEPLIRRLEERHASRLREEWIARDREVGLRNIEGDQDARQMIAAAENGYGYVNAQGVTEEGTETRFNQRQRARREQTPPLPSSWSEMMGVFIEFALSRLRRGAR